MRLRTNATMLFYDIKSPAFNEFPRCCANYEKLLAPTSFSQVTVASSYVAEKRSSNRAFNFVVLCVIIILYYVVKKFIPRLRRPTRANVGQSIAIHRILIISKCK